MLKQSGIRLIFHTCINKVCLLPLPLSGIYSADKGGGGGGVGVVSNYFFLFLHKHTCCGYSLEVPCRDASN